MKMRPPLGFLLRPVLAAAFLFAAVIPARAQTAEGFTAFKQQIRQEAVAAGLNPAKVDAELASVAFDPSVIRLDNKQPEHTITFAEYYQNILKGDRVSTGITMMQRYCRPLELIEKRTGVPAEYIVALWGSETNYGRVKGNKDVLQSVINLAYAGKPGRFIDRRKMFREASLATLNLLASGRYARSSLRGSYAGAFGNHQFMAQTFLRAAIDGDGDGRADIINNPVDSFASAANLLTQDGWQPGRAWGREVAYPTHVPADQLGVEHKQPLSYWRAQGIRLKDGGELPLADEVEQQVSLVIPDQSVRRAFLFYANAHALWRWNNSSWFVIMSNTIATRLSAGAGADCKRSPSP